MSGGPSRRLAVASCVAMVALLLAGCGLPLPGIDQTTPALPAVGAPGDAGSPGATGTPPPPPSPSPAPTLPPPPSPQPPPPPAPVEDPAVVEERIVELVNRDRASQGLAPLKLDEGLTAGARAWTEQMAAKGAPDGLAHDPGLRVPEGASLAGENVAYRTTEGDVAQGLQAQFMRSDGHRRNLLDPGFDRIGVGVVHADGITWVTQRFAG